MSGIDRFIVPFDRLSRARADKKGVDNSVHTNAARRQASDRAGVPVRDGLEVRRVRIVVAMSGGVDSATVAGLLHEQGHEVVGVHMKLHDAPGSAGSNRCCGYDDALDARTVASHLGIPFYVLNLREAFQKAVIDDFVGAYKEGRTPNPCVQCNGVLKFQVLLARARALGASHLATGHYARLEQGRLLAASDATKDQSYFLYPMRSEALAQVLFPLGHLTKSEVRAEAARLGLPVAEKPESMDVCFLPEGDHGALVAAHHPEVDASGDVVDTEGRVVGHHEGYWRFTIGQRRGLRISLGFPAYVVGIEPATRRVVVADEGALWHRGLVAEGCTWLEAPQAEEAVSVRTRHRGPRVPGRVVIEGDVAHVHLHEPTRAIAPGQAAVVYRGEQVLGGGTIRTAIAA